MSEFFFTTPTAEQSNSDLVMTRFVNLSISAQANLTHAESDAIRAEGFCLTHSPGSCLVLQFRAPLLVHPYALLGALGLRDSYLFDISKLAMKPSNKQLEDKVKRHIRGLD